MTDDQIKVGLSVLEAILAKPLYRTWQMAPAGANIIMLADGVQISVLTGWGVHCLPDGIGMMPEGLGGRPGNVWPGPYTHAEVGLWHKPPREWDEYADWQDDRDWTALHTYAYVPADLIRGLVAQHGGEA